MGRAAKRHFPWALTCLLTMAFLAAQSAPAAGADKQVSGYIETVRIHPGELSLEAKIDTGALHSSVNAADVQRFTRNAAPWVRFSLYDGADRSALVEAPVVRIARIRQHGGGVQEREVIMLGICLGAVFKTVEVNLADRSGFDFPILVGRSFLGEDFLVEPSARFLLEPNCRRD